MARPYEEFHKQNKDRLGEEFNTKHDEEPNVDETKQMQESHDHANHIELRIQAKMLEITEERNAPQPTPSFATSPDLNLDSIHREAIRRVQSETLEEKKEWTKGMVENTENKNAVETSQDKQSSIEPTMKEVVGSQAQENENVHPQEVEDTTSGTEDIKPDKTFKAKVHQIVDEAQKLRSEASRTFIKNRNELIAEAEALGSDNPAHDVSKAQREVHKTINANEHKHLHALFQENGWDYDKQGVEFVERETQSYETTQDNTHDQTIERDQSYGQEQ